MMNNEREVLNELRSYKKKGTVYGRKHARLHARLYPLRFLKGRLFVATRQNHTQPCYTLSMYQKLKCKSQGIVIERVKGLLSSVLWLLSPVFGFGFLPCLPSLIVSMKHKYGVFRLQAEMLPFL